MTPDDDELARIWAGVKDTAKGAVRGVAAMPGEAMGLINTAANWTPTRDEYGKYYSGVADKGRAYADAMMGGAPESSTMGTFGEMLGPPMKTGAKALGLIGAIRPGGLPHLQMTHALSDATHLVGPDMKVFNELSSPSFAIRQRNTRIPMTTGDSVILSPRLGMGPENRGGTLTNRDVYTLRGRELAPALDYPSGRLGQKFDTRDLRLKEGTTPKSLAQMLAIEASPSFQSLRDYENSRAGAGVLDHALTPTQWGKGFEKDLLEWAEMQPKGVWSNLMADKLIGPDAKSGSWTMRALRHAAGKTDPVAQDLLTDLRRAPAAYSEWKSTGPLPLNAETIGAAAFPRQAVNDTGRTPLATQYVRDEFERRGIPTTEYDPFNASDKKAPKIAEMIEQLLQQSGPYGGSR